LLKVGIIGAMDTLVSCPCGHTLAVHDGGGCTGERLRPCACTRDRSSALDAAIGAARTQPIGEYATYRANLGANGATG
jgi:hypothetical protein